MKIRSRRLRLPVFCLLNACLAILHLSPVRAELLSHEPFDYPATNRINGAKGGTGWRNVWSGNNDVHTNGLAYLNLLTTGQSLRTDGTGPSLRAVSTNGLGRLLTPQRKFGLDGTTLWLSLLIQRDNRPGGNVFAGLSLMDDSAERLFIGSPFNAEVWGFEVSATGSAVRSAVKITNGIPALLVVKLEFGIQGTQDRYSLFVNPTPGVEPPVPDAVTTGNFVFNQVRLTSGESAVRAVFDEVRLGESYAEVTPVRTDIPADLPFVPAAFAALPAEVNINAPGFRVRVVQANRLSGTLASTMARAESQLAGTLMDPATGSPFLNEALPGENLDGSHVEESTINYNQSEGAGAGNFAPDRGIPGIPGTGGHTDNIALEATAFLELPAGTNRFGVNSDDGFRLTIGVAGNPFDRTARQVGVFDAGRGSEDSIFDFYVERAGLYPARLVWFEGSEGANVEWFSVHAATGEKILINDRAKAGAVYAYREGAAILPPFAARIEPIPDSTGNPPTVRLRVELQDQGTVVDASSLQLELNDESVVPEVSKTGPLTTVRHAAAELLPPGSTNRVRLRFADNASPPNQRTVAWQFTVENYPTLPASLALPLGSLDPAQPGFRVRVAQSAAAIGPTRLARAEAQLARRLLDPNTDEPYANVADLTGAGADGFFAETTTINYNQDGAKGQEGSFKPDRLIPGIPGLTGSVDNISAEVLCYLELSAGLHRLGVNSDDGFRVTAGQGDPRDAFGIELGAFDGDRGAGDSLFSFVAPVAGLYPFRLVWWEGSGGASVEWFSEAAATGERTLLNDRSHPSALKAWRGLASGPRIFAQSVLPRPGEPAAGGDSVLRIELSQSSEIPPVLDPAAVELRLNGTPVPVASSSLAGILVLQHTPATLLAPGSTHLAELIYVPPGGPAPVTNRWSFGVENYRTLPLAAVRPLSAADSGAPGFRFRVVQATADAVIENSSARAEAQLAGTLVNPATGRPFANEALTGPAAGGAYELSGTINFNQDGPTSGIVGEGGFRPDEAFPGIPGTTGHADFFTTETFAWLELPAGYVRLGVNSDDGFRVTLHEGPDPAAPLLGVFEGGRGAADTVFTFVAPAAGLYPFRLVHYDGNQGSSLEWFAILGGADGRKRLLNDRTHPEAPRAWRALLAASPLAFSQVVLEGEGARISLKWTAAAGVRLQRRSALSGNAWNDVPGTNGQGDYAEDTAVAAAFYRLFQP